MPALFNEYLIIDWSANAQPKTGKDSIWWCHLTRTDHDGFSAQLENPATRRLAIGQIENLLIDTVGAGRRILVGFDFSYAYPQGFARHFSRPGLPAWKGVWQYLAEHIEDDEHNANNRFEVASQINQALFNRAVPFWACPKSKISDYLKNKKPLDDSGLAEFRLAEQGNATKSTWMLTNPGAVGGQTLVGLPYLYRLITAAGLRGVSKVWPFETGLQTLTEQKLAGCQVLHVEIYPSSIELALYEGEVKDAAQVRQLAHYLAGLDGAGELGALFAGRRALSASQRALVESEEGWILGI